jgi:hypothetical protein
MVQGSKVWGARLEVQGSGCKVQGARFMVQCSGSSVWGQGFNAWSFEFRGRV